MRDLALDVTDLGKKYRIGQRHGAYRTLRDVLAGALAGRGRNRPSASVSTATDERRPPSTVHRPPSDEIWALRGVTFDLERGQVLGIIGRNGAGKSTLLKLLSRVTEPSEGRAEIRGRVGSLLEVGTGFHPELTGRENIFLNGAILGMRKGEIDRKFDEIVDFADVGRFLDTPIKR